MMSQFYCRLDYNCINYTERISDGCIIYEIDIDIDEIYEENKNESD